MADEQPLSRPSRKSYGKTGKFTVKVEYISCGDLEGKVLLLVDPMLATGSSLVLAYKALCEIMISTVVTGTDTEPRR